MTALLDVAARLRAAGCVFAEDEARLLIAETGPRLDELIGRRCAGEPLEHLLGWAEFRGRRIAVDPGVFVPRRRSEYLVELARSMIGPGAVVVELCCGSAAVATCIATERPGVEVYAADLDPRAVVSARRNLRRLGSVYVGDLYAPLPARLRGRVDMLVANAPYVPTRDIGLLPPEARLHEPSSAYDGGPDGLDVQRRVSAGAREWLTHDGRLVVETSRAQAATSREILAADGFVADIRTCDELAATAVVGRRS